MPINKKKVLKGQKELDEYKFTRTDIASMLGITPNAVRMLMRRANCTLEYRFDGFKNLFKRPRDNLLNRPRDHEEKIRHEKSLNNYHKGSKKKHNRGATHTGKANYPNQAFELYNEMKIINNINRRFSSDAHRKEFEALNKEGLKIAADNLFKKQQLENKNLFTKPGKYGEMLIGYKAALWNDEIKFNIRQREINDTSYKPNNRVYYEVTPPKEEKEDITYVWNEPKVKEPGSDYKPGKFKYLDEAINNFKKKG